MGSRRAKSPGPRHQHRRVSGESFFQLHYAYVRRIERRRRWMSLAGRAAVGLLLMLLWIFLFA